MDMFSPAHFMPHNMRPRPASLLDLRSGPTILRNAFVANPAVYDSSRHILVSRYHAWPAIASLWPTIATYSQPQRAVASHS